MTPKPKQPFKKRELTDIEKMSVALTRWVGSTKSLVAHTVFFAVMILLAISGVGFDKVLLILTTVVSLEAIYLSIFIQMSVNRQARRLREVSQDIEEIQEDVEEIQEDVEEIAEDVEGIEKDIDEIQENVDEIQEDVEDITEDVEDITEDVDMYEKEEKVRDEAMMNNIQNTLAELMREIQTLKESKASKTVMKKKIDK